MVNRKVIAQNAIPIHPPQFHKTHREEALNRRPRLLFLAYPFPPRRGIACVRTSNIAKYLARLGWDVTVLTPHPSVWRHVDNPQETIAALEREGIRRILTGHRWRCLSPTLLNCWNQGLGWFVGGVYRKIGRCLDIEREIGWIKEAERACSILTAKDVDIILATGSPFTAFKLAKRLSDRLGRPYVLDYRDPWTGNPHAPRPARSAVIREEARLLAGCAAVTIVSPSWGLAMDRRFGLGPKLHVMTNGYDPEELVEVKPYDFGHFAIVYAGNLYPPKSTISPVMAALKRLKEAINGKEGEWYFHYYGKDDNHIREEAERFGVMERVVLHGYVPRAEALSAIRGAGVAVVITWVGKEIALEDKGIVPSKVFEALGLGTPTLVVTPLGSDSDTIVKTTGIARSFTGSDIDGVASFLENRMCSYAPEPRDCEVYAWTNIAEKLDSVLRMVMETVARKE